MIDVEFDNKANWKLLELFHRTRPDGRSHRQEIFLGKLAREMMCMQKLADGFFSSAFQKLGSDTIKTKDLSDQVIEFWTENVRSLSKQTI